MTAPTRNITRLPLQNDNPGRRWSVPRWIAEHAYVEYARQFGTSQSFDRLHERGGFGNIELMTFLCERIERLETGRD